MPDRDIVHRHLPRRFQTIYEQLCDGHFAPSELGFRALRPLKEQVQSYGKGPVLMGARIAIVLQDYVREWDEITDNLVGSILCCDSNLKDVEEVPCHQMRLTELIQSN